MQRETEAGEEGVTVIVPAFDEEAGIGGVLRDLESVLREAGRPWEILVVDDGSSDDTARVATEAGVRVVQHETNLGYGASLKTGIRRARYDRIVITDADATYPTAKILELVDSLDAVDMAVAARTGQRVHIPWTRRPAKWVLRKLAEFLAGIEIPDLNSGLRAFRKSTVEREYLSILPNGFSFTTTISLAYHADSRLVRYVPINYEKRVGASKIRPLQDTYGFCLLILRTVMYFDPMRIFMPPALLCLLLTLASLTYDVVWERNIADKSLIWLMITVMLFGMALLGDLIARRRG